MNCPKVDYHPTGQVRRRPEFLPAARISHMGKLLSALPGTAQAPCSPASGPERGVCTCDPCGVARCIKWLDVEGRRIPNDVPTPDANPGEFAHLGVAQN